MLGVITTNGCCIYSWVAYFLSFVDFLTAKQCFLVGSPSVVLTFSFMFFINEFVTLSVDIFKWTIINGLFMIKHLC